MNSKQQVVLGVDIGGSHMTAALVNQDSKVFEAESQMRVAVNSFGSSTEIIHTWASVINSIFDKYEITDRKIGIAMPGPFDYDNGISLIQNLGKYDSLFRQNVKELLASRLGVASAHIRMMNDAACFLRGEVYWGAARGYDHVIGITLGTGTGTAIHHHSITKDANLGPSPFKESIADEYFSTRWFVNRYHHLSGKSIKDVKAIADLYDSDILVRAIFLEFVVNLAEFLAEFVRRENPNVIVMGGNIAQCSHLFVEDLQHELKAAGVTTPIVKAMLGEEAAILGAASLFNLSWGL
jgi:glucokinase